MSLESIKVYSSYIPFLYFRAAPDYETAIRNKLGNQLGGAQPQQQISWQGQPKFITDMVPAPQQSQPGYSIHEDHFHNIHQQQGPQQGGGQGQHQHPASSIYSTSTPELNRINLTYHHQHQVPTNASVYQMPTQDQIFAELQRLNLYKPPPPYPGTNNPNGQHQHIMVR